MNYLLPVFMFCSYSLLSQSGTVATGSEGTGSGGTVSYSVGQIDFKYSSGTNGSINQGLQQPYEFFTVGIDNHPEITLEMTIFPNPTIGELHLIISSLEGDMKYIVFDEAGKNIISKNIHELETLIDLKDHPIATYYLKVLSGSTEIKVFKIIKN